MQIFILVEEWHHEGAQVINPYATLEAAQAAISCPDWEHIEKENYWWGSDPLNRHWIRYCIYPRELQG